MAKYTVTHTEMTADSNRMERSGKDRKDKILYSVLIEIIARELRPLIS